MKILATFLVLLCLSFSTLLIELPELLSGRGGIEYDVRVINGFTSNSSLPLVIWCASEDTDLGGRALQERDDFGWSLKTRLWTTTRFMCTMKWDQRRKKFDAFKVPRDVCRCGHLRKCSWLVTEDGFYFSNDEVNWKKEFSW